ncbi:hypothetical protein [Vreelandella piezotolerans]|uniref:hypothetical protein n=1 Tax=Vreelandella piezotolerans TaxID=2609667 RepID=UPI0014449CD6|nr:hypothetical protein [Halomonas piezotolerans]
MPRFKIYNYDQNAMVVINYQDLLQPDTFEHSVHLRATDRLQQALAGCSSG